MWLVILAALLFKILTNFTDSSPILTPNSPLYIRNGGSLALTCEIDQDVAGVTWMRNGYSSIQITNTTVCNFRKLAASDMYNYSVTCEKQRKFSMVKHGVNGSDHNTTWRCQMYSLDYTILGPSSDVLVLMHDSSPILYPNSPLYIRNGGSISLTCEIDQDVAVVTWMRNGYSSIQITNTTICNFRKLASFDMHNYSMTCDQQRKFSMVKHGVNGSDHNTTWRCQMYSLNYTDLGSSSDVTVLMHELPSVKSFISPMDVVEGNSLEAVCQSDGIPSPQLTWSPQGEDTLNQSRLYFHFVTRSQTGTYICTANNTMMFTNGTVIRGSDYKPMFLNVLYAATITEFFARGNVSEIMENRTLELYCRVNSNPYSVISLTFGDVLKSITTDTHEMIYKSTVGCLDAGNYICSATNSVMNGIEESAEVNLKVLCHPRFDNRKSSSTQYYRELNDNVTFEVNVVAYPEPINIMWYHREHDTDTWQQILNQPVFSLGLFSKITIHLGSRRDFGAYLVNMSNTFGRYERLYYVLPEEVVQSPQGFQVGPVVGGVLSGAVVAGICITLVIIFMRRRKLRNKKEGNVSKRKEEMSTNESSSGLGAEYEGLHVNMTEVRPYSKLNDVSRDGGDNIRKADSDNYDKLQQYTNADAATYTSLSQEKSAEGGRRIYENTGASR